MDKWECIAENLQKARKKCGYSYQKLADKTGLSKSTLQRYESGAIRSLPLEKAEQLAQALNITPAELLGWHELNQYKKLGNLDRLRELVQADREGTLLVIGSKIEEAVYTPPADVALIVHGRWIEVGFEAQDVFGKLPPVKVVRGYRCNVCNRFEREKEPYCHCGAKMDLED